MKSCIALWLSGVIAVAWGFSQPAAASAVPPAILLDVPYLVQTKDGCGSAAIAMVLRYWNRQAHPPSADVADADADPANIQAQLLSPSAGGIRASDMHRYFQRAGYRVFEFSGGWTDLEHHLALGRPLIVSIQASPEPHGPLHYVVVVGINAQRDQIFLNDPALGKNLRLSRAGFEQEWKATHNWMLLALPVPTASSATAPATH